MAIYETIRYEKMRKGVLITLNRPEKLNSMTGAGTFSGTVGELHRALAEAEADPEVRAVVLTGAGRAFSAGYDVSGSSGRKRVWPYGLEEGDNIAQRLDTYRKLDRQAVEHYLRLWELEKPTIAAVNGWCLGAGSFYAMACHIIIAAEDAVFGEPEVRMSTESSFFWALKLPVAHVMRYALTGDHVDAQELYRLGAVLKVVPNDQLLDEAFSLVERIANISPETVKINLQVITRGFEEMGLRSALSLNAELNSMVHVSKREEFQRPLEEAMERGGLREFLQKRDGPFSPEPFGPRSRRK
ncbi:MAG: enoyl-CoA hydratase/isomerase family protein [Chloroflexi bacterium]|nr:enoyl-CoA hydratase/isomerase family protein [Chloroflexota bacterium]